MLTIDQIYKNGMYWIASSDGFIDGQPILAGQYVYIKDNSNSPYLLPGEVQFVISDTLIKNTYNLITENLVFKLNTFIEPTNGDWWEFTEDFLDLVDVKFYQGDVFYYYDSNFYLVRKEDKYQKNTRWTYQKPTILWSNNTSQAPEATCLFQFNGHMVDLYFQSGPSFGKVKYTIGDLSGTFDCYDPNQSIEKVLSIDTGEIKDYKLRLTVLGEKNPASTSDSVSFFKSNYNQVLSGDLGSEEFYSEIGKTITIGS